MISWTCQSCVKKLRANDADAGKKTRCPHCKAVVQIPKPEPSESPTNWLEETPDSPGSGWDPSPEISPATDPDIQDGEIQQWLDEAKHDPAVKNKTPSQEIPSSSEGSWLRIAKRPLVLTAMCFLIAIAIGLTGYFLGSQREVRDQPTGQPSAFAQAQILEEMKRKEGEEKRQKEIEEAKQEYIKGQAEEKRQKEIEEAKQDYLKWQAEEKRQPGTIGPKPKKIVGEPPQDDTALRLQALDREAMELFRNGKLNKGFEKLVIATEPYRIGKGLPDCTPAEALAVAVACTRTLTLAGRDFSKQTVKDYITLTQFFSMRGGIDPKRYDAWFEHVVLETRNACPPAKELLAKSQEFLKTRKFGLAESTLRDAILACGDTKEAQLFEADLYLWLAVVKGYPKTIKSTKGGTFFDSESVASARKLMLDTGKNDAAATRRLMQINQEFRNIMAKKKN